VWRRRHCSSCDGIFTTLEQIDWPTSLLYKDNSSRVGPFERDILYISVYDSLKHRKKAVSEATALTATITAKLLPVIKDATIQREDTIRVATEVLRRFDKAAAIAYQAFHPL